MKRKFYIILSILLATILIFHFAVFDFNLKEKLYHYDHVRAKVGLMMIPDNVFLKTHRHEKFPIFYIDYENAENDVNITKTISLPNGFLDFKCGESDQYILSQDSNIVIWHYYWNKQMEYSLWVKNNKTILSKDKCQNILQKKGIWL